MPGELRPQPLRTAHRGRDRVRDPQPRRRLAGDLVDEVEQSLERRVLASEHEAVARPALLERERVALRHVLDEGVRPAPVAAADESRQAPVQVVGDHARDDVALGHVARAVHDARVEDHHVVAPSRGLARRRVGQGLRPLVRVAEALAQVRPRRVELARPRGAECYERRRVHEPGRGGARGGERVPEPAEVGGLEALGVGHPDLDERGHVQDGGAALGRASEGRGVRHVAEGCLGAFRQAVRAARRADEHAQRVPVRREVPRHRAAQETGRAREQDLHGWRAAVPETRALQS